MLAILAAALLAAAPQNDTVFMADGGRVVGTVIEEAPQGVTIQLPDGTVRKYPAREVFRIEYSDGTVSAPRSGAAPAVPAPVPPAAAAPPSAAPVPPAPPQPPAAQPQVYAPPAGQQPPQYAPPQPPPAYTPPPPPQAYPPQPPPAYQPRPYRAAPPPYRPYPPQGAYAQPTMAPISPIYGVLGFGGLALSGNIEKPGVRISETLSASQAFDPQFQIYLEGGLRLDPAVLLGLYLDIGVGSPASDVSVRYPICAATSCTATTGRVGILLRHTFTPLARTAPWIAAGTGFEFGGVTTDGSMGGSTNVFSYTGWEALRLMAGVDFRSNPVLGFGLYGAVSFGTYTHYEDDFGQVDLGHQPYHTMVEAGLRMTLFP